MSATLLRGVLDGNLDERRRGDLTTGGDATAASVMASVLGYLASENGQLDEARRHYGGALAIHRAVGNRRSAGAAPLDLDPGTKLSKELAALRRAIDAAGPTAR